MNHLDQKLKILNDKLEQLNRTIEIHLIGAHAIELHGISIGRRTEDIDNIKILTDDIIINLIHEVGEKFGEPEWFDLGAVSITLPSGYKSRLKEISGLKNITIKLVSIQDLICLKANAYYLRREQGIERDIEDLINLAPTKKDIIRAIEFMKTECARDLTGKFQDNYFKEVSNYEKELQKLFKE